MAPRRENASKTRKPADGGFEMNIPPDLKNPLEKLQKHEKSILKAFNRDPRMAELFLTDPGAALARMGIPADPLIRKRARLDGQESILRARKFCLPGGRTIAPRIKVRFVAHTKEAEDARR